MYWPSHEQELFSPVCSAGENKSYLRESLLQANIIVEKVTQHPVQFWSSDEMNEQAGCTVPLGIGGYARFWLVASQGGRDMTAHESLMSKS